MMMVMIMIKDDGRCYSSSSSPQYHPIYGRSCTEWCSSSFTHLRTIFTQRTSSPCHQLQWNQFFRLCGGERLETQLYAHHRHLMSVSCWSDINRQNGEILISNVFRKLNPFGCCCQLLFAKTNEREIEIVRERRPRTGWMSRMEKFGVTTNEPIHTVATFPIRV